VTIVESDRAAIDDIRRRLEASENANDAAATGELLTDDAVLMVPDFPVQEGKAACVAFMDGVLDWVLERFDRRIAYLSSEVAFAGDAAFDRGSFAFTVTPKSGGPGSRVTGKYLWLLRRDVEARWKVSRIIISRDDAPEPDTPLQRERVTDLYLRLLEAWNRQDAAGFADLFSEDASVVGFDGSQMKGRTEIETTLKGIFASHRTARYVAIVREIRPLATSVAFLRANVGMVPPGQTELSPAVNAIQSVVTVGESDEMRVALLQNTPAAFHGRLELAAQLTRELSEALRSGRTAIDGRI
jgi:uncharacterized protein (TIGR02246 family)